MLGTDRGVVEPCRHRMRRFDVAGVVLEDERMRALQHARRAAGKAGGMAPGGDRLATRLDANEAHMRIVDEGVEDPDGVAATADAGDDGVRRAADELEALRLRLAADH